MALLNVKLTDPLERFIQDQVAAGRYQDADEVLRAALRLLEQQAREGEAKLAVLRALAANGFASLDRGEAVALEGEQELADFIGNIGRRAAQCVAHGTSGP